VLVGVPLSTAQLNFKGVEASSNILEDSEVLLKRSFPVKFTDCEVGDYYVSDEYRCVTCSAGTYSLDDPYDEDTSCKECDTDKSTCLGGSKVAPKEGYWRLQTSTDIFLTCR